MPNLIDVILFFFFFFGLGLSLSYQMPHNKKKHHTLSDNAHELESQVMSSTVQICDQQTWLQIKKIKNGE